MSGHTPGPWNVAHPGRTNAAIDGPDRMPVAWPAYDCRSEEERAANARLIAAAPDLLKAVNGFRWLGNNLHNIVESPDQFRGFYEAALRDAREAIAKAEPDPQSYL